MKLPSLLFVFAICLYSSNLSAQTITLEEPIRYLALGDSYTIGQSVSVDGRWPNQLSDSLTSMGYSVEETNIIATTGWTTSDLLNAIEGKGLAEEDYNLVSLLIGVNNQYQGQPFNIYEPQFLQLLDSCLAYVGGDPSKVFIVSIPDYAFTPFGQNGPDPGQISAEIDIYNVVNKSITDDYGIAYFNITPISRMGIDQPYLVAQDGLHPSGAQYSLWVEQIMAFISLQATSVIDPSIELVSAKLFPNPAKDSITITFQEPQIVDSWRVYDASGKEYVQIPGGNQSRFEISVEALPSGTYFLSGQANGKLIAREIFVVYE